jgi:hypothetical protein
MMHDFARNRLVSLFLAACVTVALFSCHQSDVMIDIGSKVVHPESVYKLDINNAGYGVTKLEGLSTNDDIYLAKVKNNRAKWNRNVVSADSGAGQEEEDSQSLAEVVTTGTGETFLRYEKHWRVTPPDQNAQIQAQSRNRMRSVGGIMDEEHSTTKKFYVDISPETTAFELKSATLRKIGAYCKVWVIDEYYGGGGVSQSNVKDIAEIFDEIYPLETNILGYEYGGGPGGNGGMDGDPKIQILLFDIDGSGGGATTYGYFYPGDEFARGDTYPHSNEAEIFYIDSVIAATNSAAIYSTLIHEFNHMINFNLKVLQGGDYISWNTEVWYTEMLSMLAEDIIGPLVGIFRDDLGHVINVRIPSWIKKYADLSVMYWPPSSSAALYYYASNYAFGAYLMRNFGGPALFSAIAKSNSSGRGSIDGFMRIFNGVEIDTAYAMDRFNEALLYSGISMPEGVLTFDKEVFDTIGEYQYTFEAFNIWDQRYSLEYPLGPLIREYAQMPNYAAPANTVQLYTDPAWTEEIAASGGSLLMRLLNVDTDADYYIMTKPR